MSGSLLVRRGGSGKWIADVCIVGGGGHVGLPLGLMFAGKGRKVLLHDLNHAALRIIAAGKVPFMEKGAEGLLRRVLKRDLLRVASHPRPIAGVPTVIVTIGTPVDAFLNPMMKVIRGCVNRLLPYLSSGQLLVLRSTVYPGTTAWLDRYLQSKGRQMMVAFCPERVVQGCSLDEIPRFPQIVGATTPAAELAADRLFHAIVPETVHLSPLEAEFAKLFGNAHRYIQFAIANQLYMIATSAGVDYGRILDGMRHNYPRARDIPRAGFTAGPCLFKDTMQLAAFSGNHFSLGHAAMFINEGLVLYLVNEIARKHELEKLTVGLLGMAFKADNNDTRGSLSYKLKKTLTCRAKRVLTTDPHVMDDPDCRPLQSVIAESDLLILCVPHGAYRGIDTKGRPVVDVWNCLGKGTRVP